MEGFWHRSCSCNTRAQYQPRGRRPRDKHLGSLAPGGNGLGVSATAFDECWWGGDWHFPPEWRGQEAGGGDSFERVLLPRAALGGFVAGCVLPGLPFSLARCGWRGFISISDQLFGLPEAWAGCRDGAAAKLDRCPMNGSPEQGQWWGRDVAPTLLGRLDFLGKQKSEGGWNVHLAD